MPQKSILNFFGNKPKTDMTTSAKCDTGEKRKNETSEIDSPVKKSRRIIQPLISDDEEEDGPSISFEVSRSPNQVELKGSEGESSDSPVSTSGKCEKNTKKDLNGCSDKSKEKKKRVSSKKDKTEKSTIKQENTVESNKQKNKDGSILTKKGKTSSSKSTKKELDDCNGTTKSPETEAIGDNCKILGNDQSGSSSKFNPNKLQFHPINDAIWKHSELVPYQALASTLNIVEATGSRLKMIDILANYFRSVIALTPQNLLESIYLCLNKLGPAFEGIELGLGDMVAIKAIGNATGRSTEKIKISLDELGDLGQVAEQSCAHQKRLFKPAPLTVSTVFKTLKEIAGISGNTAMNLKVAKVTKLLVASEGSESKYIIRSLSGKLRIGLAEQSLLQALAQACVMTPPGQEYPPEELNTVSGLSTASTKAKVEEQAAILKETYCICPTYDKIIPILIKYGIPALPDHCKLSTGIPLKPMLASPTRGIAEVVSKFDGGSFMCEYKYDGERAQIHVDDGQISIFSRNQENNTSKYPDIISRLPSSLAKDVKSCILDSEVVAWDIEQKTILPFQILSTRKRKDAREEEIKVQVCIFVFDVLYHNGHSLVKETLRARREVLKKIIVENEGQVMLAKGHECQNTEEVQELLEESIIGKCEGLMVKSLDVDATYEIAKRSKNWLKLKKDYLEGVGDTLDLVVIGGYTGKGKRTGMFGGFLLACYDPDQEQFQAICKIGTGFSDEDLEKHAKYFKEFVCNKPKSYYQFETGHEPDHWFEPTQVWEVKCADLSISPIYKAASGLVDPEKGISLRFPRFIRVRDDKKAEDATTSSQISTMYKSQEQVKTTNTDKEQDEEDFY